jgi:hypothetical protein
MADKSDKSKLEGMLEGNTLENKQQNANEFVAPGGRGVNDYSLEAPGLANNLRVATEAQERSVKMMPVMLNQLMGEHFEKIETTLTESTQRIELLQRKSAPRQKLSTGRICPASTSLGLMMGFLVTIGVSWFWVIPAQIAHQRGADWAIGEYLATPEGRAVRNHYRNCKTKGCKK